MTIDGNGGIPMHNGGVEKKPLLVFLALPLSGHTYPTLHVAGEMIRRGYSAVFMSTEEFRKPIEKIGAEWYEQPVMFEPAELAVHEKLPPGQPRLMYDMEAGIINKLAARYQRLKSLLEMVREREPGRQVVVMAETISIAALPFRLGAPLPKGYATFPKTIGLNTTPVVTTSVDTGPLGSGLPPDGTESGRARNKMLHQLIGALILHPVTVKWTAALAELGCTDLPGLIVDAAINGYDTTFQLCGPSLEYPMSDMHPSIRFSGALPRRPTDPAFVYPTWWADLVANAALAPGHTDKKKVVVVTQGTYEPMYEELIIPALTGLAGCPHLFVVAILGVRGATLDSPRWADLLPAGVPAENTHVIDYLPYDMVLEYTDVFVTNAGYGGVLHSVINGVPMVVAGMAEDKADVSMRVEWAGFGVNLRTQTPTAEAVVAGVEKALGDPAYKQRAERLRQENEDLDAFNIIERQIRAYAEV